MKTLWFFLGGLAVLCAASLSVNVFLLWRESDRAHQISVLPMPPVLRSASGAGDPAFSAKGAASSEPGARTAAGSASATGASAEVSSRAGASGNASPAGGAGRDGSANAAVPPLLVREVYYTSYDRTINVYFATNGVVDFPLSAKVRLSPAVSGLELDRGYGSSWELQGSFEPERTYQLTIRAGVESSTGEIVREDLVFNVKIPPLSPQVRFLTRGPYYPAVRADGRADRLNLPLGVTNVKRVRLTLNRAYANNLALRETLSYRWRDHQRLVKTTEVAVSGVSNREQQIDFDLSELLSGAEYGIYTVWAVNADADYIGDSTEVVLSDLGLTVAVDRPGRRCQVLVRSLTTGAPAADADVQVVSTKNQPVAHGRTDATGLARLEFLPQFDDEGDSPSIVVVRAGMDASYLLLNSNHQHDLSVFANDGRSHAEGPEAFVYTERGICRPGETMAVSLYVRERSGASTAAVSAPCQVTVSDPQGRVFVTERITTDAYGFATVPVPVPANARTGEYSVDCGVDDKTPWGRTAFVVAAYVPDRLKVSLKTEQAAVAPEEILTSQVSARYYFGQEMTQGECDFRVSASLAQPPAHWRDYQVGDPAVFVSGRTHEERGIRLAGSGLLVYPGFAAAGGRSYSPVQLLLEATVREPGGRGVTERLTTWCHPTPFYLGIRQDDGRAAVRGDDVRLQFRRLAWGAEDDIPAAPVTLNLKLYRVQWDCVRKVDRDGDIRYVWEDVRAAVPGPEKLELAGLDGELVLPGLMDGRYELIAEADQGVRTRMAFWHWQGEGGSRSANPNVLSFVTDRQRYAPGDTAEVTLTSPGDGYFHVVAGERRLAEGFAQAAERGANRFRVAIPALVSSEDYYVGVTLVCPGRSATRNFGLLRLAIDQNANRLGIELTSPVKAAPGEEVGIGVKLAAADGKPCGGQVQVFAVDEGILALTGYETPDIFSFFHGRHFCPFEFYDLYSALFPDIRIGAEGRIGGDGVDGQQLAKRLGDIKASKPAVWIGPVLAVPASGEASLSVRLPEHVGALRLMAVGVSATAVGSAERELVMRDVVSVLATAPRAVAPGDEFTVTLTAFNHDLDDGSAELEVQVPSALAAKGETKHAFALRKGASHTVQMPCVAGGSTGSWDMVCTLRLGSGRHQSRFPITVRPLLPPVTQAVTLAVPAGETQRIQIDQADWLGKPTAKLRVSASPALGVKDAMDWLNGYPYGCLEQTTAAAFPFLGVDNMVKTGLLAPGMVPAVRSRAEQAMAAILAMMQGDGSFTMWPGSPWQWPEASVFAAHYLFAAAQVLALPLDADVSRRVRRFLLQQADNASLSRWQRAYSAYVLALSTDQDFLRSARNLLMEQKDDLPSLLAAAALIRGGYAAEGAVPLQRVLGREVWRDEQSGQDSGFASSSASRLGMVLALLMDVMPSHPATVRLATELQTALRPDGSGWGTTHANAWVAYGLASFAARQGVGLAQGSISVTGGMEAPINTEKIQEFDLAGNQEAVLVNTGTAPYYIRLLVSGIPTRLEERRDVLEIHRQYVTATGREVTRVEQGRLLTVKITVRTAGKMNDLVLVDMLPGGFEIEDEQLATRAYAVPRQESAAETILRPIFIEKRDDRFLFFGDALAGGTGAITYRVRAVSRGKFALPPVRMEGMYDPEVQGTYVPSGFLEVY